MTDEKALALRAKMLGAMLRLTRLSAGRSLKEVAALIGTTPSSLADCESGKKAISLPELELFSLQLNVPLQRFRQPEAPMSDKIQLNPAAVVALRQGMVAAQMRARRGEARLTLKKLSAATGIAATRLSAYEQCDRPVPLPHLEAIAIALGQKVEDYIDTEGPFGEWDSCRRTLEALLELPAELRDFVMRPANQSYLRLAKQLSELSTERLRALAEDLLDLTL